jgi:hypothetical protein
MSGELPDTETPVGLLERASRYRRQAEQFERLAIELQPRARAQLLGLAAEYDQLADTKSRKPSANLVAPRGWNN